MVTHVLPLSSVFHETDSGHSKRVVLECLSPLSHLFSQMAYTTLAQLRPLHLADSRFHFPLRLVKDLHRR